LARIAGSSSTYKTPQPRGRAAIAFPRLAEAGGNCWLAFSPQLGDELAPVRAVIRKLLDEVSPSRLRLIAVEAIHTFFSQFSKRLRRVSGFLLVSAARASRSLSRDPLSIN
jgi:hypothetical protein